MRSIKMYAKVRSKNAIGPTALLLLITLTLSGMSGWWGTPSLDGTLCKSLSGSWSVKEKICYINGNGNFYNTGSINVTGSINNYGSFYNSKTIYNFGRINNYKYWEGCITYNKGSLSGGLKGC
jgi:hypothetical protein